MARLFGTDGVRGIANESLTCSLALRLGHAAAEVLVGKQKKRPLVAVGMDTRISSDMLANAVSAGLCSSGADVLNLGVIPTPAVAYLVRKYHADAGIMISASHNPAEFNGIKIFSANGYKLPDELEERIEELIFGDDGAQQITGADVGRITSAENAVRDYCEYLRQTVSHTLDGLKIAVDCANGAASVIAPELFKSLGAECFILNANPNGMNINDGCGSTHMEGLRKYVLNNKADIGIAFDGDADRCLCIDEKGNEIDGDFIMAICALDMKKNGRLAKNTVIGTVMTNLGFIRFCERNGVGFIPTKVGDRYVLEEMLLEDYSLGGEQSGHVIFRDFATTGDGALTALKILSVMYRESKKLSELAAVMSRYPQVTENIKVSPEGKIAFYTDSAVKSAIEKAKEELGEGGRLVVRVSGTEPLIRVMAEGDDTEKISRTVAAVAEKIKNALGG